MTARTTKGPATALIALTALALAVGLLSYGCGSDAAIRFPEPAVRYVAFGDSSTAGPSDRDYPSFLADLLGEGSAAVGNEGLGGETTGQGLERLRSLIARGLFPNAHTMLYWQGGNDLVDWVSGVDRLLLLSPEADNYPLGAELEAKLDALQANIEAAIREGQQAGWRVLVATYYFLPRGSLNCEPLLLNVLLPGQADNANAYVRLLNERIGRAAANTGAELVDVADLDESLRGDGVNYHNCNHLSPAGNGIVAELFLSVLRG